MASVWPFSYRKRFFTHNPKLVMRSEIKIMKKTETLRTMMCYVIEKLTMEIGPLDKELVHTCKGVRFNFRM